MGNENQRRAAGSLLLGALLVSGGCDGGNGSRTGQSGGVTLGELTDSDSGTEGTGDTGNGTDGGSGGGPGPGTSTGDDTDTGSESGPKFDLGGVDDTGIDEEEECAAVSEAAELVPLPADIIVVVDNSGSMSFEAGEIQSNLNDFSNQIIASGIDVHVILISSYPGNGHGICIDPPLGGGGCPGTDDNAPVFTHVNQGISSHNAWSRVLSTHGEWGAAMREESSKHVLVVTDDTADMGWSNFDQQFRALDPSYEDYFQHSVVCHSNCASAAGIGTNYITLSNNTGGVAADLCDQDFQAVFDVLLTEVIGGTQLACEFEIPPPPDGEDFDPDKVNLEFNDGLGGVLEIGRVDSAKQCAAVVDGWYYDDPVAPQAIIMCPQTCEKVQVSENGSISIAFGCATIVPG